jgi:hypothetical protein
MRIDASNSDHRTSGLLSLDRPSLVVHAVNGDKNCIVSTNRLGKWAIHLLILGRRLSDQTKDGCMIKVSDIFGASSLVKMQTLVADDRKSEADFESTPQKLSLS